MAVEIKDRIYSIDALRGFDFIWILGVDGFFRALAEACPNGFTALMKHHVSHFATGVTFYDLVMPTFVFISACSFPFWLSSREKKGWSRRKIVLDVFRRLAMLTLVGGILAKWLSFDFTHVSYAPLFTIIGFAWAVAGLSKMFCGKYWFLTGTAYFAVQVVVFAIWPNAKELFDQWLTPWHVILRPNDPVYAWRATIVLFCAVSTGFIGCWAGSVLKRTDLTNFRKCAWLAGVGAPMTALGYLSCLWLGPAMKPSWNPQFVLIAGGYSMLMLAFFHLVCDAFRCRRWAFAFKVIGMNAMAIYILKSVLPLRTVASKYFMAGIDAMLPADWTAVADSAAYFLLCYAICHFLYRRQVFIRI